MYEVSLYFFSPLSPFVMFRNQENSGGGLIKSIQKLLLFAKGYLIWLVLRSY